MAAKVRRDEKGIYWVVIQYEGRRTKKRVGRDRRIAEQVAKKLQAKLVLGELKSDPPKEATVPFGPFAEQWLRREVALPIERGIKDHSAPGTARIYRLQVNAHLRPYFGDGDLRSIGLAEVQGFYDRCLDTGRPRSAKSIDMALNVLRMILSHARRQELLETNAVEQWKADRPRRRSSTGTRVPANKVLSGEELQRLLDAAESDFPRQYPLVLFLSDTGARFGEAAAIRWSDLDLESGTVRISRSFSSGVALGTTKTGRSRVVEPSQRLRRVLATTQPNVFPIPEETLIFPNQHGGFLQGTNFRARVFSKFVREILGEGWHYSPHCLRHTWASLHMARGTPLKWIQE